MSNKWKFIGIVVIPALALVVAVLVYLKNGSGGSVSAIDSPFIQGGEGNSIHQITNNYGPKAPPPGSREAARAELLSRGLSFSADGFRHAIFSDDADVVELYLKAGENANSIAPGERIFAITVSLFNTGHEIENIDVFKKYGADFATVNNVRTDIYTGQHPSMGTELLKRALQSGRADIVDHLIEIGVDPSTTVADLQSSCRRIPSFVSKTEQEIREAGGDSSPSMEDAKSSARNTVNQLTVLHKAHVPNTACPLSKRARDVLSFP